MKTVIVGLTNITQNDNYNALPLRWNSSLNKGVEIVLNMDPIARSVGDKFNANFDIIIDLGMEDTLNESLRNAAGLVVSSNRLTKTAQHRRLLGVFNKNKIKDFLVVPMYEHFASNGWINGLDPKEQRILLKAPNGARGIGQVVLERSGYGTMHALLSDFIHHLSSKRGVEDFASLHGTATNIGGMENHVGESENVLSSYVNELDVYGIIDNVETEWRVWTDYDCKPFIVGRRSIQNRKGLLNQATFINEYVDESDLPKGLQKVFDKLSLRQMSVDVFRTTDGKWGLFEWQPQTGIASVPADKVYEWHTLFVESAVQDYLKKKR